MADTPTPPNAKYAPPFEAQFDKDRAQEWMILRLLRLVHTAEPVRVLAVRPTAGQVGYVDVQPLILDQDTQGYVIDQTPIYNIPYLRMQGGKSAIILDPAKDDIGLCVFAERDTTNVLKTRQPGAAPTNRHHSTADGFYLGGFLNADPVQYLKFLVDDSGNAAGMSIFSSGPLTLDASGPLTITATDAMTITAPTLQVNATTTFSKDVTAPELHLPNGAVNTHVHYVPSTPGDSQVMHD